jgi:hypothetical protein
MREYKSGATRDDDRDKLDFEGFLSPLVLKRYCEYLHEHRTQADGKLRDSDNWQKGIPKDTYMKSKIRHGVTTHLIYDGFSDEDIEESLCAEIFNAMGYLFELLKEPYKPGNRPLLTEQDKQQLADAMPPLAGCEAIIECIPSRGWQIRLANGMFLMAYKDMCRVEGINYQEVSGPYYYETKQEAEKHLTAYLETQK